MVDKGGYCLLRLEGVDFDATLNDTQQLSVLRGGSLTLLQAPVDIRDWLTQHAADHGFALQAPIVLGASIGAYLLRCVADGSSMEPLRLAVEGYLRRTVLPAPHGHMSYVVDIVTCQSADDLGALHRAQARNRTRQFQRSWALPAFDVTVTNSGGTIDPIRPATKAFQPPGGEETKVSASFAARHNFGRTARQQFYAHHAGSTGKGLAERKYRFTNSFAQICDQPFPEHTPVALKNKLAIFYSDGNKFSHFYHNTNSLADYSALSNHMRDLQQDLLRCTLDWLVAGAVGPHSEAFAQRDGQFCDFRFETLLWGGDELTFVMPAWLGLAFVDGFIKHMQRWSTPDGQKLTQAIGMVFCHHKTPIRQARALAKLMADDAKKLFAPTQPENLLQIEAFESVAVPDSEQGLSDYRNRLYGQGYDDAQRSAVTLTGSEWDEAYQRLLKLCGVDRDPFPRSQIHRFLQQGDGQIEDTVTDYFERVGLPGFEAQDLKLPNRSLRQALRFFNTLYDYAALPAKGNWPAFDVTPLPQAGAAA